MMLQLADRIAKYSEQRVRRLRAIEHHIATKKAVIRELRDVIADAEKELNLLPGCEDRA